MAENGQRVMLEIQLLNLILLWKKIAGPPLPVIVSETENIIELIPFLVR
jgi:hypothetical protein